MILWRHLSSSMMMFLVVSEINYMSHQRRCLLFCLCLSFLSERSIPMNQLSSVGGVISCEKALPQFIMQSTIRLIINYSCCNRGLLLLIPWQIHCFSSNPLCYCLRPKLLKGNYSFPLLPHACSKISDLMQSDAIFNNWHCKLNMTGLFRSFWDTCK